MQPKDMAKKKFKLIPGANYEGGPISKYGTFGNMLRTRMVTGLKKSADSIPMDLNNVKGNNIEQVTDFVNPMRGATLVGSKYAKLMGTKALDSLVAARKRLSKGDKIQDIEEATGMIYSQGRMKYPIRDFDDRTRLRDLKPDTDYTLPNAYKKGDKDEFFMAYPDMKAVKLRVESKLKNDGSYDPSNKSIKISSDRDKGTLAHESMHGIQDKYNLPGQGSNPISKAMDNDDIAEIVSLKYGVNKDKLYEALTADDGDVLLNRLSKETNVPLTGLSSYKRYRADEGEMEATLASKVFDRGYSRPGIRTSPKKLTGFPQIDRGTLLREEVDNYLKNGWGELYD